MFEGHTVLAEGSLEIPFEGLLVPDAYQIDLLVDDAVVVEANTERFFGGRTACVRRTARSAEGSRSWTKPGPVTNRYGFSVITGARFDPLRGVRLDPGRMKSG